MARHFKSNSWAPRVSGTSGSVHLGRTDETSPRSSLVPIPVLMVGFKSTGIALTGVTNSIRPPQPSEQAASPPPAEDRAPSPEPAASPEPPPVAEPDNGAEPASAKERRAPSSSGQGDSIDLIIDKLPRHALVKPIPVTISPLGDRVFIASTADLDITVTGNSLSDALLLLKQQLESTYESLRGKASGREEERQLRRLREYIRDH
jgi:hypothetical protein